MVLKILIIHQLIKVREVYQKKVKKMEKQRENNQINL